MDFNWLINFMAFIGFVSSILTILSSIFPESAIPIISLIRNYYNKRLLYNKDLEIIVEKNFCCKNEITPNMLKSDLKEIFAGFNFKSEIELMEILGNMERLKFHINSIVEIPTEEKEIIIFKQKTNIKFKDFYKGFNVLFENFRAFETIDYLSIYDDRVSISIKSNMLLKNRFINIFGEYINGENLSINKNDEGYNIILVDLDSPETIEKIKDILVSLVEI
ncbi:hypothetical protein [Methanobrevibacter ruminantium]|uniref:hypothetical protein n=1 Tax=Methanobrevibacter ruminantium TaxID=83816 RepID=UPI0026F0A7D0|nr:hypothetical protein [Methanobrevibacter ruminantium]